MSRILIQVEWFVALSTFVIGTLLTVEKTSLSTSLTVSACGGASGIYYKVSMIKRDKGLTRMVDLVSDYLTC